MTGQVREITVEQFHTELKAQGVSKEDLAFKCVVCGTIQSMRDLVKAGAGKDFEDVEKYIGFSCVGRWTGSGPYKKGSSYGKGCDWTLGGLFRIHRLEVVTPDGEHHPRFELATPEEARAHAKTLSEKGVRS